MAEGTSRIVVADHASGWRQSLVEHLQTGEIAVDVVEDGEELRRLLVGRGESREVVIVGSGLRSLGGLDALFLAARETEGKRKRSEQKVLLIAETRADVQLLELLRSRGVNGFLYREDPLEGTITVVHDTLYADVRANPRFQIKLDVAVILEGARLSGVLEDLSLGGARVVLPMRALPSPPAQGGTIDLEFELYEEQITCRGQIRRLETRKSLLKGERMVLGLKFALEQPERDRLEAVLDRFNGPDAVPEGSPFE